MWDRQVVGMTGKSAGLVTNRDHPAKRRRRWAGGERDTDARRGSYSRRAFSEVRPPEHPASRRSEHGAEGAVALGLSDSS